MKVNFLFAFGLNSDSNKSPTKCVYKSHINSQVALLEVGNLSFCQFRDISGKMFSLQTHWTTFQTCED